MQPFALSALLLLAAATLLLLSSYQRQSRQRLLVQRLGKTGPKSQSRIGASSQILGRWHWSIDPEVPRLLDQLGWRHSTKRAVYLLVQFGLPLAVLAVMLVMILFGILEGTGTIYGLCLIGVAYLLPKRLLVQAVARRKQKLADEVSIMVPMLRMLFEVGMAVEQTLRAIMNEGDKVMPELCREMTVAMHRVDAGLELKQELRAMADMLDVDELTDCVTILEQLITQGGGALASLAALKSLMDDRRLTTMQERVSKLSAKMSAVMVAFLFPALLIVLAGPGFIALFNALKGVVR